MENLLKDILLIRTNDQKMGTAFVYKYKERKILFSARHLFVKFINQAEVEVEYLTPNADFQKVKGKLLKHSNDKIDIIAIEVTDIPFKGLEILPPNSQPAYLSDTFFIGYPYGMFDNSDSNLILPFRKKAFLSALRQDSNVSKYYLDGHTNTGFSGGPVFIKENDDIKLLSIMSGNYPEKKRWINPLDKSVIEINENSGIIITIDFKHALEIVK